jgi:hypothetical protein
MDSTPLSLRFAKFPCADTAWASAEVLYAHDDQYTVTLRHEDGRELRVTFLSRTAAAEFLDLALRQDHSAVLAAEDWQGAVCELEDTSAPALMRYLTLLRDARG